MTEFKPRALIKIRDITSKCSLLNKHILNGMGDGWIKVDWQDMYNPINNVILLLFFWKNVPLLLMYLYFGFNEDSEYKNNIRLVVYRNHDTHKILNNKKKTWFSQKPKKTWYTFRI